MILGDRKGKDVFAFIENTSIGTAAEDENLESVVFVLNLLSESSVRLKLSKCDVGARGTKILGYVVDEQRLRPSEKHTEAIRALVEPRSGGAPMRFLGPVNYFAEFVHHFADTAATLYEVVKGMRVSKKQQQRLNIPDWNERWGNLQRKA